MDALLSISAVPPTYTVYKRVELNGTQVQQQHLLLTNVVPVSIVDRLNNALHILFSTDLTYESP